MIGGGRSVGGERGVSNVLAVVLLIGITTVGVVVVLVAGWATISDVNQDANTEIAEESLLKIDSVFQQSSGGNASFDIPDEVDGKVSVSHDPTYNLTLNENATCSSGARDLSSIRYEESGKNVGYEGGGVWRLTEAGTTMSSPPDVTYENGSLSVAFVDINGQITSSGEIRAQRNVTAQQIQQRNMSRALYTNGTYAAPPPGTGPIGFVCKPSNVQNATLKIEDSLYARGWANWARNNYDDRRVSVNPTGTVNPGDTVEITFQLGDVSDPHYAVSNVGIMRSPGSQPQVTATVTNTGGLRATRPVRFSYDNATYDSQSVTLDGGESTTVTQPLPNSRIVDDGNPHNLTVIADETAHQKVAFDSQDGYPNARISSVSVPSGVNLGAEPSSATVTLENSGPGDAGDMTAIETLTMTVDGTPRATWNVSVPPEGTKTVHVGEELPTSDTGTYRLEFSGDLASNTEAVDPFTVGEAGYFSIQSVSPPTNADEGDAVAVDADVKNTGGQTIEDDVIVRIENGSTGALVAESTTTMDLNGDLAGPPESQIATVSHTFGAHTNGLYTYTVETPNETQTGNFYVGPSPAANFVITGSTISKNPVAMGNQTTFDVRVNNTGSSSGTQTVRIANASTGATIASKTLTLAPNENRTAAWTVTANHEEFDYGNNKLRISTANTSLYQNLEVHDGWEPIDSDDGKITVEEGVRAEIEMNGAELEGYYNGYTFGAPVEMHLRIENETGEYSRLLWEDYEDGDVNHPEAERRMRNEDYPDIYTERLTLAPDSNLSLFARSYYCDRYVDSDVIHEDVDVYDNGRLYDIPAWKCDDRGPERIAIDGDSNSENVVILGDGDELPAYQQAGVAQLGIDDMLGGKVSDDGRLQLADDERVFLYELSKEDASPGNAHRSGDPDYNDAVATFRVVSLERTVQEPAKFRITDVDVPSKVNQGEDTDLDVTVTNFGGKSGSTPVRATFAGIDEGVRSVDDLGPGESETVSFGLDTAHSTGTYEWTTDATASSTPASERSGFVTIGDPPAANFLVSVSGPATADVDDAPEATVKIYNTGAASDTQDVTLFVRDDDAAGGGFTEVASKSVSLASGNSKTRTFDLPRAKSNYTYYVETEDVTASNRRLFVGESAVSVVRDTSINIGTSDYDTGGIIERRGGISRMNVKVQNSGTVGDERDVRLTITNKNTGATVVNETVSKRVGSGNLAGEGPVPAYVGFDSDLDPGYYIYNVTVYSDTESSGNTDDTVTGELFLQEVDDGDSNTEDSPISVDSSTITVGSG
ncbi:hypothetical protein KTS45_10370 [Halomicroarcula limicola]|uniref:CARDB domain-containing protein n=1 Tax=Haloarcula limicola TaxID=1429915 RepID=A0A8J7Y5G2_9EURY|nr:hypothetical protein [Halomicroarcula limicola]MBV0924602.1 hypothetical protein [Halomicroarcula limicola]